MIEIQYSINVDRVVYCDQTREFDQDDWLTLAKAVLDQAKRPDLEEMVRAGTGLDDREFDSFLALMSCSDPWPCEDVHNTILIGLADRESKARGFENWIVALHEF